jgi:hypothetical protein
MRSGRVSLSHNYAAFNTLFVPRLNRRVRVSVKRLSGRVIPGGMRKDGIVSMPYPEYLWGDERQPYPSEEPSVVRIPSFVFVVRSAERLGCGDRVALPPMRGVRGVS